MSNIELAAIAAYEALRQATDRIDLMPPWTALAPERQATWREVADAVQMASGNRIAELEALAAEFFGYLYFGVNHQPPLRPIPASTVERWLNVAGPRVQEMSVEHARAARGGTRAPHQQTEAGTP